MKFTNFHFFSFTKSLRLFLLIQILTLFKPDITLAWSGYDFDYKTEIDIGPGNLVREGSVIQFYDTKDDNFHTAKVIIVQSIAGGTEVVINDLDTKKERSFIMY